MKKKKKIQDKPVPARRLKSIVAVMAIIFVLLVSRIGWIQFVQGAELKELASRQQTLNKIINPKRGAIYDSNGKALAISADVDTITINPSRFIIQDEEGKKDETKTLEKQEFIAKGLSNIFSLDYNTVLAQVQSEKSVETIITKVEADLVYKLKEWMEENEIETGINIDGDNKRYYPYDNLASHIIGFTGTDSVGLYGIEKKWNTELQGTAGKIVTAVNRDGSEISGNAEQYIEAKNGSDLYLTIDVNVQSIAEKYLEKGVVDNKAEAGSVILMKPKTGEILAMATYPDYNLNEPFTINNQEDSEKWNTYSQSEKSEKLYKMWTDKNFSSTYEPGSTFKLIISAAALEENITGTDVKNDFHCEGFMDMGDDIKIKCAASAVHGNQSLRDALRNSCNGAFIQLGQRIGTSTLYKYFEAFGLFEKTGIGITGEQSSDFHKLDNVGPIELATTSFGQRFTITPLQLINAVSAIANNGTLIKPKIVKQIKNSDTGTITEVEQSDVRKVISEETAKEMRDMMKSVAEGRGNIYGNVVGYTVGGKTGTSEPPENKKEDGYVVSYTAIAPADDPEIVGLVVVYKPATENPYGSRIAAPILSNILSEVLPYLGIASGNSDISNVTTNITKTTKVPNVTNKTLTEAKKSLENVGFNVINSDTSDNNSVLVKEQVPDAETVVR